MSRLRVRERGGAVARRLGLDRVQAAWRTLPAPVRKPVLPLVAITLGVLYPYYRGSLPEIPIFGPFPNMDTAVIALVFAMMAVGLNIVVGYAGLLDLGYVAFYAMGAYTAAWFASPHFANVRFDTGFQLGLIAFTAAVLGGIGNLPGAVLGALLIGLIQAFNEGLRWNTPGGDWTQSIVFTILILILVFRPQGLLGERTPEGG